MLKIGVTRDCVVPRWLHYTVVHSVFRDATLDSKAQLAHTRWASLSGAQNCRAVGLGGEGVVLREEVSGSPACVKSPPAVPHGGRDWTVLLIIFQSRAAHPAMLPLGAWAGEGTAWEGEEPQVRWTESHRSDSTRRITISSFWKFILIRKKT